jgi:membrane associated rhomboid family serine protease
MNLEREYEKRFGEFPLSNITNYLIGGQILVYILGFVYPGLIDSIRLQREFLFAGQWWRLITFLFIPFAQDPIWIALAWYFMYMIGTALEAIWGSFRYALYLAISIVATIVSAMLFPGAAFGNGYIFTSLFLAFAYLNPDFKLLIFFIIPVKIKWIALLSWIGLAVALITGGLSTRIQTLLSVGNFLIFFGQELYLRFSDKARHGAKSVSLSREKTYMKCAVCKRTEKDQLIFYYCHTCNPHTCYCEDHINDHPHKGLSN